MLQTPTANPGTSPGEQGPPHGAADTILTRLRELEARQTSLHVRLDSEPEFFSTRLLRLDPGHGWLFLEELTPYQGHLRVAPGRVMQIYTTLDGTPLHFQSPVLHTGEHDDAAFYVVEVPEAMDDAQKRLHFRTHLSGRSPVELIVQDRAGREYPGHLDDLSLGGLRALLPGEPPVDRGDLLQVKDLALPGEPPFACGLQVRFARQDTHRGGIILGGRFYDLEEAEAQRLLRVLLRLERERHHPAG
ncbi:c-di-GMP-binding flagellar brake protein YcgR, contains PilZNR and PilZ domains [Ectothiorhodospira mobilis]|uniref:C-di-GMP-binding flagellar brake protein YcgR, contains PilZNR and PilZ domains n=1 Tax=Ectothiorhodospira mobilis TaxID=195064 RepID=A0A1I4QMZ7_ECTMO|nr:flagellar brake protein [Ectothiorhodospira mobilis]SFM41498.1 c-di-GMP-binding flagellar brake protein YcgR, contains PilZNR and PilZ domains [Ectothiorhodospira mobilis]